MASSSLGNTVDVTPHDTNEVVGGFDFIMVNVTGSVSYIRNRGGVVETITMASVPSGVWIPAEKGKIVKATGTSATGIMVV